MLAQSAILRKLLENIYYSFNWIVAPKDFIHLNVKTSHVAIKDSQMKWVKELRETSNTKNSYFKASTSKHKS